MRGRALTEWHGIVAGVPAAVKTTVTELPDSRVRLQVQVPASELEGRLERKAHQLGRELKLPGFRRGKVPAPLVIQRIGREAVLEEAVRDTLSSWYSDAIETAGIVPVGDPQVALGDLPPQGEALEFSIEIGVLPKAELGEYQGLEVARREPAVEEEQIEQEIEAMRERLARLQTGGAAGRRWATSSSSTTPARCSPRTMSREQAAGSASRRCPAARAATSWSSSGAAT